MNLTTHLLVFNDMHYFINTVKSCLFSNLVQQMGDPGMMTYSSRKSCNVDRSLHNVDDNSNLHGNLESVKMQSDASDCVFLN